MPHLIIAGAIHESGIDLIETRKDFTYTYLSENDDLSYKRLIKDADALVIRTQPLSREDISRSQKLKVVSRHGVGYDAIDVDALTDRNIPLTIVGDVNSQSVAEHAMTLLLAAFKRLIKSDLAVRQGPWAYRNELEPQEVNGKNLLILGYGRIGMRLAKMASSFGMNVSAFDPYISKEQWDNGFVTMVDDFKRALSDADCISINMPKLEQPLIGKKEFDLMKAGVVIINTARGGIVNENDLFIALSNGRVGAAGLDVFDEEPPSDPNRFAALHQVILSPHVAGLSQESAKAMAIASVRNIINFFDSELDMSLIVNNQI